MSIKDNNAKENQFGASKLNLVNQKQGCRDTLSKLKKDTRKHEDKIYILKLNWAKKSFRPFIKDLEKKRNERKLYERHCRKIEDVENIHEFNGKASPNDSSL